MLPARHQSGHSRYGGTDARLGEPRKKGPPVHATRIAEMRQSPGVKATFGQGLSILAKLAKKEISLFWHPMPVRVELDVCDGWVKRPDLLWTH